MATRRLGPGRRGTAVRTSAVALGLLVACAFVVAAPAEASRVEASICPGSAGRIAVLVVVDAGGASSPEATCVDLPAGSTGLDALAARAQALGRAPVRSPDGLSVCGIDGFPTRGCLEADAYWSYWWGRSGGSAWTYATIGAATQTLSDGDVEGWRWTGGADTARPRPRRCPDPSACAPTTTTTSAPAPSGSPAPTQRASEPDATVPSVAGATTIRPAAAPPHAGPSTTIAATPDPSAPTTTTAPVDVAAEAADGTTRQDRGSASKPAGGASAESQPTGTPAPPSDDGASAWWIVGLVVAAGGLALAQSRRTRLRR